MMKRPEDSQNHGPSCINVSLTSVDWNLTMKNPLEQRWISQCRVHFVNIQWCSSKGFGQKLLNRQMMACDSKLLHTSSVSGISIFSYGVYFSCSTMYGLGFVPACFRTTVGVLSPCKMFLNDIPPFLCFCCGSMLCFVSVLVPLPPPICFVELKFVAPPRSLRLSVIVDCDIMLYSKMDMGSCRVMPPYNRCCIPTG